MRETYMTLEEAAVFEGIGYKGMHHRVERNSGDYKTKTLPAETGGKPRVAIAVSSLSVKARKAYRASLKLEEGGCVIEPETNETPWYVDVDLNWYIENHKEQFYAAVELAGLVQKFIEYGDDERTAFADEYAQRLGISRRTLYRHAENVLEASAWALKLEGEDGRNYDYFKSLSLCRKPKESGSFPSLTEEQRAIIENIWFDKGFAANLGTVEMLYVKFTEVAERRGWEGYPSIKTVGRYVKYIMDKPGIANAHYLAANGTREFKRTKMLKCKRDATTLDVLEYVVCDTHTFDLWVQYKHPNGKIVAVRPKLVAMMDMRSRIIFGDVASVDVSSQTLKESYVKGIYADVGGVMKHIKIDNGRDYTGKTMTGINRKERIIDFDSETKGFFQSIGIEQVTRSLPYQAWDKPIERAFGTVCTQFSKQFDSYVGTLTGSKTYAKRHKDIKKMLERGELLTMEEFFDIWTQWKNDVYHKSVHRGLKDAGEKWLTPIEVFENAPRYEKAAPPREYAAMLLMKADTARVRAQGITKFGVLYTHYDLCHYVDQTVGVKWDIDDVTKLYVYDGDGRRICEAHAAELLEFGDRVSQNALEEHKRSQNRQTREAREYLDALTMPPELRLSQGRKTDAVGKLDITIKAERPPKVIALPDDKEYRAEISAKARKAGDESGFLGKKAESALTRLRAINE